MRRHQLPARLAVLAVCGGVLGLWSPTSAVASCAAPHLQIGPVATTDDEGTSPAVMSRTRPVTVSGEWFHDGCNDTGTQSGCSGPTPGEPEPPMRDIVLTLAQGGSTWRLGTANAAGPDRNFAASWVVHLPADVEPGPAVLRASSSSELKVEIAD